MSRTSRALAGLLLVAALGACSSEVDGGDPSPTIPTITVGPGGNLQFSPATITINAGQFVRFVWPSGSSNHNVSPDLGTASALPASPGLPTLRDGPYEFNATFPAAGTFRFYCTAHGGNPSAGVVTGMAGTITVN